VNLYSYVGVYVRALDVTAYILDKGVDHARSIGVNEAEMLDWRLIDDMQPLRFQVMVVCNFSRQWLARAADLPLPAEIGADLGLADFRAAIADAKSYLEALTPDRFEGRDEATLTVSIGGGQLEPTLSVERWVSGFATTNLYFHMSMAYAILRAHGVAIGKIDLFPTGL